MCRKFGWCEALFASPDGAEMPRSALPPGLDAIAVVRAGYRAIGFVLTAKSAGLAVADRRPVPWLMR